MRRMINAEKQKLLDKQAIDESGVIVDENDREFNGHINFTGTVSGIAGVLPTIESGDKGKVLTVKADETGSEWKKVVRLYRHAIPCKIDGTSYTLNIVALYASPITNFNFLEPSVLEISWQILDSHIGKPAYKTSPGPLVYMLNTSTGEWENKQLTDIGTDTVTEL